MSNISKATSLLSFRDKQIFRPVNQEKKICVVTPEGTFFVPRNIAVMFSSNMKKLFSIKEEAAKKRLFTKFDAHSGKEKNILLNSFSFLINLCSMV